MFRLTKLLLNKYKIRIIKDDKNELWICCSDVVQLLNYPSLTLFLNDIDKKTYYINYEFEGFETNGYLYKLPYILNICVINFLFKRKNELIEDYDLLHGFFSKLLYIRHD